MSLFLFLWPVTMANVDRYYPELRKTSIKTFNPWVKTKLLSLESNNAMIGILSCWWSPRSKPLSLEFQARDSQPTLGKNIFCSHGECHCCNIRDNFLMIGRIHNIANTTIWYSLVLQLSEGAQHTISDPGVGDPWLDVDQTSALQPQLLT